MRKIEILLDGHRVSVVIDGNPVEKLTKFQFEAEVGSVPIVRMEQWAVSDNEPPKFACKPSVMLTDDPIGETTKRMLEEIRKIQDKESKNAPYRHW